MELGIVLLLVAQSFNDTARLMLSWGGTGLLVLGVLLLLRYFTTRIHTYK